MGKLIASLVGVALGVGATIFSYNYHIVRADKEWLCVPRKAAGLSDVYADIRAWRIDDWRDHGELAQSLLAHGRGDLVTVPAARGFLNDFLEGISAPKRVGEKDDDTSTR